MISVYLDRFVLFLVAFKIRFFILFALFYLLLFRFMILTNNNDYYHRSGFDIILYLSCNVIYLLSLFFVILFVKIDNVNCLILSLVWTIYLQFCFMFFSSVSK